MPPKRATPFNDAHELTFGLKVCERDPSTNNVVSASCRFCVFFGREVKVGAKRKATKNIQYFRRPFRKDVYIRHLKSQHPLNWETYSDLPKEKKATFFEENAPMVHKNSIRSCFRLSNFNNMSSLASSSSINISDLETKLFINNEFVDSTSGKTFPTINPATEEIICQVQEADAADVDKAVQAATAAFALKSPWRSMAASDRGKLLWKLADLMESHTALLEELESLDNGKPLGRGGQYGTKVDVALTIAIYRYAAGWCDKMSGDVIPVDGNTLCYTRKEPVGVCGCIIPWNFPLAMQSWKLAPALAAGCTVVMKTSEKTPLSALFVSKLIVEAGFPAGVVNTLSGYGPTAGHAIVRHPGIDKIAFTGSTLTAASILREAGLKRTTMELGGKSPVIVCDDADLEVAITMCHVGLFLNQGQCCCAGSRIYVQDTIYDAFVAKAIAKARSMKTGAYTDEDADHGPQVDDIQFNRVMGYIEKGKAEGATCSLGGNRHGDQGYFVEPTIFTDVSDDMTIAREEIFGPVMSIMKFTTDDEVIQRANTTMYGLGAGIMSQNIGRAIGLAHQIRAGSVWINCYDDFSVQAPFGGYKASGHGREKGKEMMDNYLETKCVFVPLQGPKC